MINRRSFFRRTLVAAAGVSVLPLVSLPSSSDITGPIPPFKFLKNRRTPKLSVPSRWLLQRLAEIRPRGISITAPLPGGALYGSKELANSYADQSRLACIKVSYRVGEGL